MGGAYSTHERDEKFIQNFGQNLKARDHLEEIDIDGKIILKLIFWK
jgi:hypothetical protein